MPGTRYARVALTGLAATLLTSTACIDRSLAVASNLAPQPRQSVLLLESSDLSPAVGSTVTIRGRLLRGAQVAPAGAFTLRLTYDSTLLALAPAVRSGVDASGFGTRAAVAAAPAASATAPTSSANEAGATASSLALYSPSRKSFPARAAARVGDDTLVLQVVRARAARQAALATSALRQAGPARTATSQEAVLVPEGLRAVHLLRDGEVRVASVVPDGLQGDVLFEVPFVVKRAGALGTLALTLDELVGVAFDDQRAFTRVERAPVRRSTP
jgi:hypothetical protein